MRPGGWTSILRLAIPSIALVILGSAWSWASPPGSAADEGFHLASIWCAWGDSDSCLTQDGSNAVSVPDRVANAGCFSNRSEQNARCTWLLTNDLVETTRVNPRTGGYPQGFYTAMRAFVGPDVNRSVLMMRMANSLLAGLLLFWLLVSARPVVGRAAAMAWTLALVPTGIFFIASANPSSWAIIGGGLCWAFLLTLARLPSWRSRRAAAVAAGALVTAAMALLARSDSAWVLLLSLAVVVVLEGRRLRERIHFAWLAVVAVPIVAVALVYRVGRYLTELSFSIPPGNAVTDQPNPLLKTMLELPAFLAGIFGLQQPSWMQREAVSDWNLEGYTLNGFSFGVGALDVANPSIAGVLSVCAAAGAITLGLGFHNRRKLVAIVVVGAGIVTQVIVMRGLASFGATSDDVGVQWVLQPRYYLPSVMLLIGMFMLCYPVAKPVFNRLQASVIATALSIAAFVSLTATVARFMHGQAHSWVQLNVDTGWWWSWGPSPVVLVIVGGLAGVAYMASMVWLGASYPHVRSNGHAYGAVKSPVASGSDG